ncbi:hypothetical protein [Aestuariirhabdus sp. LZHN29]|uniref:hypothetical protein n=1 Tax=Aestuariirhabdus sp. LZHN29 TaxID=3417462 RepID=UPI003CF308CC
MKANNSSISVEVINSHIVMVCGKMCGNEASKRYAAIASLRPLFDPAMEKIRC